MLNELHEVPVISFLQPIRAPSEWHINNLVHTSFLQCFVSSTNLQKVYYAPSFSMIIKMLNSIGGSTEPKNKPPTTSLQLDSQ